MPCPQPDDPAPQAAATAPEPARATVCVRCKANPAVAIFRDSIYCQSCGLAVFDQKAKSGLEFARGAGLAKYVAAEKAMAAAKHPSPDEPSASSDAPEQQATRSSKAIINGAGNAEVNVSANIAIALSGGPSSRALLRTATQYFRPESSSAARRSKGRGAKNDGQDAASASASAESGRRKNVNANGNANGRFNEIGKIFVFYIDVSAVVPGDAQDRTESMRSIVEQEGCPDLHFVPLKIEDIYRQSDSEGSAEGIPWKTLDSDAQLLSRASAPVSDPRQAIKALFSALHPSTLPRTAASSARTRLEDLHRVLIQSLLRRAARQYDCAALLLGDSATRISIRLIEDLAKGAGHKLAVQGSDAAWIDDTLVVRPLKSHLMQEVLFYTSALGLESLETEQHIVPPLVSTADILANRDANVPTMDKSSIARLTETFILNLEKGVPSTVSTIGKTGSKLVLNPTSERAGAEGPAHSTSAFQHVGPSVSLRSRDATGKMSALTLNEAPEPRIGSRGIKLAQASAGCFRWTTQAGCALCGMPSQQGARHWKRNITISSLAETAPTQPQEGTQDAEWIELSDHLCYACLLVLAIPTSNIAVEELPLLPAYVLEHIIRSQDATNAGVHAPEHEHEVLHSAKSSQDPALNGHNAHCASTTPLQPLNRAEIKAQINDFLLPDA
ncbi:hypothetical protein PaG_04750 [Moesziomyces aphidis]|uniref:Cytoplasmic tRNA 2-thiolation protein 2 n=1 Tax=Moesziomyces aphidis TaxID=84754 RepID=W3VJB5_MOEAP|nr:hypothetical protein PaG_04750 [Moesziomyces aphidis]